MRQDEPSGDNSSILYVFERLNTGGLRLSSQEIRSCIYHGPFDDLLEELNENVAWREVFGRPNKRKKDLELILRFIALYHCAHEYKRPMKLFLNSVMAKNRFLEVHSGHVLTALFSEVARTIKECLGRRAFRPLSRLNAATAEAVMVAIAKRLERGPITNRGELKRQLDTLFGNDSFLNACLTGTADEENVRERLRIAIDAFADLQ